MSDEKVLIADYRTIVQTAKDMQIGYHALDKWIKRNDVPVVRLGNTRLVRASDLVRYTPRRNEVERI